MTTRYIYDHVPSWSASLKRGDVDVFLADHPVITKDDPCAGTHLRVYKDGDQLGCVQWIDTRTQEYEQIVLIKGEQIGLSTWKTKDVKIVRGTYDVLEIKVAE